MLFMLVKEARDLIVLVLLLLGLAWLGRKLYIAIDNSLGSISVHLLDPLLGFDWEFLLELLKSRALLLRGNLEICWIVGSMLVLLLLLRMWWTLLLFIEEQEEWLEHVSRIILFVDDKWWFGENGVSIFPLLKFVWLTQKLEDFGCGGGWALLSLLNVTNSNEFEPFTRLDDDGVRYDKKDDNFDWHEISGTWAEDAVVEDSLRADEKEK